MLKLFVWGRECALQPAERPQGRHLDGVRYHRRDHRGCCWWGGCRSWHSSEHDLDQHQHRADGRRRLIFLRLGKKSPSYSFI